MSEQIQYSATQLDAIRDVMNVGLISAADMLQKLLSQETSMLADKVQMEEIDNLEVFGLIPAIYAKVEYNGALNGKCVIIIRQADVRHMLNLLMNIEDEATDTDDELELDDITFNTVRELLNQMTMAFGVTLSDFFGEQTQVSVADIVLFDTMTAVEQYFGCDSTTNVVSLTTQLGVKEIMSSCYCIVLENALSSQMASHVSGAKAAPEVESNMAQPKAQAVANEKATIPNKNDPMEITDRISAKSGVQGIDANYGPEDLPEVSEAEGPRRMQNVRFPDFGEQQGAGFGSPLARGNMDLLMDVPLNVTVEIGKTRKKMREIMDFTQGTVIGLEKQAGAPVDIVVNGQLIARGDVVVIDDNFGVRVTEIVGNKDVTERNRTE